MESRDKKMIKDALENQREDERYNEALSREVSSSIKGKKGYEKYIDLMEKIRKVSREKEISIEDAAKEISE